MAELQFSSWSQLEADLWEAADNLRANSKLTSTEYCMPVLGVSTLYIDKPMKAHTLMQAIARANRVYPG